MPRNRNVSLFRVLSAEAEALSCAAARNQFPVLLRPIAERRRVTSVEFRPLLVDAMLTTHPNGFRILFNSYGANPLDLKQQFDHETRDRLMPPRLRFSLAHELAHTLFYDLSDGVPRVAKQFRSGGGRTELENLERNCNKLAAQMLLPTAMVKAAFRGMKAVNPQALIQLAHQAEVSIETLVRRLCDESSLLADPYFRGCIVLAKQTGEETTVIAVAKPPRLNIAACLLLMRPGERWQVEASNGTPLNVSHLPPVSEVELTVETAQAACQQVYQVAQIEVSRTNSTSSHLLTFEEIERL